MKKRILIYTTGGQGFQEGSSLEEAANHVKEENEVLYLTCANCIGGCLENPLYNKAICCFCSFCQKQHAREYTKVKNIRSINDYYSAEIGDIASSYVFEYDNTDSLKKLIYKDVSIGYGALSSYISLTRNMEPNLSTDIRNYIDKLLRQQLILTEIIYRVLADFKPDLIVFHNGRFAQYKPLMEIAKSAKIDYICTETILNTFSVAMKNYIFNDNPHSCLAAEIKYKTFWNANDNIEEKISVGKSFFENRRYGKYAGDKIYIKNQISDLLPDNIDNHKENIVIFNSSEDEFCSINKEVDSANFFGNQLNGIREILEFYRNDSTKHFYLRVHPNLIGIPYSYHTDLYKLNFPNLTVIPADSKISSYALLDIADKVIVFGSTMGIEATYWGKAVICLAYSLYKHLNVVYIPLNKDDLWELINDKKLLPKPQEGCLMYGYYYMSEKHEKYTHVPNYLKRIKLFKKKWLVPAYQTFYGSNLLYILLLGRIQKFTQLFNKIKCVPK